MSGEINTIESAPFCTCCGRKTSEIKADLARLPWTDNKRVLGKHQQIRRPLPNGDWAIFFYEGLHLDFCAGCGKKLDYDTEVLVKHYYPRAQDELISYKCSVCGMFEEF